MLASKFYGMGFAVVMAAIAQTGVAQASTYGPLPSLSPNKITKDTCYLRDQQGRLIDLNRLCNGSEVILPSISVKPAPVQASLDTLIQSQISNAFITIKAKKTSAFVCGAGFFASQCKSPAIEIMGGKKSEALQQLTGRR